MLNFGNHGGNWSKIFSFFYYLGPKGTILSSIPTAVETNYKGSVAEATQLGNFITALNKVLLQLRINPINVR